MFIVMFLFFLFLIFGFYSELETTNYTYHDMDIPKEFHGFRIAFISDFHCEDFGDHEEDLIQAVKDCKPDILVFTGDMIDGNHPDLTPVIELISGLSQEYPIYAVSGNHEYDVEEQYSLLLDYYDEYGVINLDNTSVTIHNNGESIGLYGKPYSGNHLPKSFLEGPDKVQTEFNMLLYHDATAFPVVSTLGYNLVLSGHTHGGVVRLPIIGGLINNNGGIFAEYEKGIYAYNNSTLISSRGLGDAKIPRFYNRSELICIELHSTQ